ncbi:MAG: 16S rRNA (cytidine(1402)-2'-O)-methyltransferase [Lachnospiraceae bacterium]|nr:16S rRNA (cytidine(1402)-2'-O)-methyltransferase [Lachnospiraceae bacterium]
MTGTLYLCATPIGNLGDITKRVLDTLSSADIIAAEDTRHTLALLNHFNIKKPLISYYEHNKEKRGGEIIALLKEGKSVALVTDAGTPGISDPGSDIAALCHEEGICVTSLPGACAVITALSLSGLMSGRFVFEGFLPLDKKEKAAVLKSLEAEKRTVIFYEAPHRLIKTLLELKSFAGERRVALARELTKKYEEIRFDSIDGHIAHFEETKPKGEFVIIVEGMPVSDIKKEEVAKWAEISIEEHFDMYIKEGLDEKEAMKRTAKDRGISKREVYARLKE